MNKARAAAAVLIICFVLSGCSGGDLQQFFIATAAAIDVENGQYRITLEGSSNKLGQRNEAQPALRVGRGATVTQCLQDIESVWGEVPYMRHSILIILSRSSIDAALGELMSYLQGEDSIRLNVRVVMAKEGAAAALLSDKEFASSRILKSFTGSAQNLTTADVQLYDLMYMLDSEGIGGWIPISGKDGTRGIALLRDTSFGMFLEPYLVPSFLMMGGNTKGGSLAVNIGGKSFSFSLSDCKADMKAEVVNGTPLVSINIKAEFRARDMLTMPVSIYENALRQRIVSDGIKVFDIIKEAKCDAFGAGQYISRFQPKVWEQVRENWGEMFAKAELKLEADCLIVSGGKTEGE